MTDLPDRTKRFASRVINVYLALPKNDLAKVLVSRSFVLPHLLLLGPVKVNDPNRSKTSSAKSKEPFRNSKKPRSGSNSSLTTNC